MTQFVLILPAIHVESFFEGESGGASGEPKRRQPWRTGASQAELFSPHRQSDSGVGPAVSVFLFSAPKTPDGRTGAASEKGKARLECLAGWQWQVGKDMKPASEWLGWWVTFLGSCCSLHLAAFYIPACVDEQTYSLIQVTVQAPDQLTQNPKPDNKLTTHRSA